MRSAFALPAPWRSPAPARARRRPPFTASSSTRISPSRRRTTGWRCLRAQSPELEIVGITTVAGNYNLARAKADVLRMLEMAGRTDDPRPPGRRRPLVHEGTSGLPSTTAAGGRTIPRRHRREGSRRRRPSPERGGFSRADGGAPPGRSRSSRSAPSPTSRWRCDKTPLREQVKQLMIMGGAIASLPDGAGNKTPNAEFNF